MLRVWRLEGGFGVFLCGPTLCFETEFLFEPELGALARLAR